MRKLVLLCLLMMAATCHAESTFVFFRHAEKQMNFSGQLSCQGMNRALRLPKVLLSRFGEPDQLYASAPIEEKEGSSVRALATLMPTAIQISKDIILKYHANNTDGLINALKARGNHQTIFIAWEHEHLVEAVKSLITTTGGDASSIPFIYPFDYDSIYVVKLDKVGHFKSFTLGKEGLDGLSSTCVDSVNN
ncbi:histidine phosphatase family protein [Rosenbergiella australiborealis]|uniref:histidine phosphatase family protein n=1 Tax=Rosenbergiella australiborealis TaxID=1544696 RepID=UPI001F4D728B|nr:histidine phosphatase family protein [Rosenbergiella australiborealis]